MGPDRLTTPMVAINNTSRESQDCYHDDDAFKYHAYIVTYLLIFPVAFLFNVGALTFLSQRRRRRSASSIVMMNLALSDSSFALTLPLRLAYYFKGGVWDFPDWVCRLCVYGFYVNLYTSILFLTLLSVLRWLAVAHPFRHRTLVTPTRVVLVCTGVWMLVAGSSSPFLFDGMTQRAGSPRCFEPASHSSWERLLILNYVAVAFGFLLPFLTIILCYGQLIQCLMANSSSHSSSRSSRGGPVQNRRCVHLVTMVMVTFLLFFLPYHVIRSLHLHAVCSSWSCDVTIALQRAVVVTLCLAACNSVVNPFLYYYSTKKFRNSIRESKLRSFRLQLALIRKWLNEPTLQQG